MSQARFGSGETLESVRSPKRLCTSEIGVLKLLAVHCGAGGSISLDDGKREAAKPLWRRGLIGVWYRQAPELGLQGPYFGLSISGSQLAAAFHNGHGERDKPRLGLQGQLE